LGVAVLALAACGIGEPPGRTLDITSAGLTYQADLAKFSGNDIFTWDLGAPSAYFRFDGTALTDGSAKLTVLDAAGAVVLAQPIGTGPAPSSTATTAATESGPWTLRIDIHKATGPLSISAVPAR